MKDGDNRVLSEEDTAAIARQVWELAKKDLYINAGKGVVNLIAKAIILGVIAISLYGMSHGWFG